MRRRSGFTLVELLIVLAVIAALLATLTPVAVNAVRNANASAAASDVRTVREAIQSFYYTEKVMPIVSGETLFAVLYESGYLTRIPNIASDIDMINVSTGSGENPVTNRPWQFQQFTLQYTGAGDAGYMMLAWEELSGTQGDLQVVTRMPIF